MTDPVKMAKEDGVLISRELLAFLCGDGPLDGHYFGEKPEHERGNFWWRKALRAAEAHHALEQAGEPVADRERVASYMFGMVDDRSWSDPRITMLDKEEWLSLADAALRAMTLPTLQRLGQEFDAGEGSDAFRIMQEFYLSSSYDPKAGRHADVVQAAIAFAISGSRRERPDCTCLPFAQEEGDCEAHPPQSRGQAFDGEGEDYAKARRELDLIRTWRARHGLQHYDKIPVEEVRLMEKAAERGLAALEVKREDSGHDD